MLPGVRMCGRRARTSGRGGRSRRRASAQPSPCRRAGRGARRSPCGSSAGSGGAVRSGGIVPSTTFASGETPAALPVAVDPALLAALERVAVVGRAARPPGRSGSRSRPRGPGWSAATPAASSAASRPPKRRRSAVVSRGSAASRRQRGDGGEARRGRDLGCGGAWCGGRRGRAADGSRRPSARSGASGASSSSIIVRGLQGLAQGCRGRG